MRFQKPAIIVMLAAGILCGTRSTLVANPLVREQVSSEAKWLIHMDLGQLRKSQLGTFLFNEIVEKKLPEAEAHVKAMAGVDLPWRAIESITAYGTDFKAESGEKGVLLVQTSTNIQGVLDLATSNLAEKTKGQPGQSPLRKETINNMPVYRIGEEVMIAAPKNNLLVMGKKMSLLESACAVVQGKGANFKESKSFNSFPTEPTGFFLVAVAEGFNQNADLPPQAKVLQMADGARVVLGENGENLFLNLMLRTKNAEGAQQIQQVFQGLMALALLNQQNGNKELTDLVQKIKVTGADKAVTLSLDYPVTKALEQLKKSNIQGTINADAGAAEGDDNTDTPKKKKKKKAKKQDSEEAESKDGAPAAAKETQKDPAK